MKTSRIIALTFGVLSYIVFLVTFLSSIGFVSTFVVPKSIDSGPHDSIAEAVAIDVFLLGLFAVQHSVMARPGFKQWWTRIVPEHVERSAYVLASSVILAILFWQWRPIPRVVWWVEQPILTAIIWAIFWSGWFVVLVSTFLIDHFDLFGLSQVYRYAKGLPHSPPTFHTPALYRIVRHPIMLGFMIAFWATPIMTWGHLLFAVLTTAYIFVGVWLEERDLRRFHGKTYDDYRQRVAMIVPWLSRSRP